MNSLAKAQLLTTVIDIFGNSSHSGANNNFINQVKEGLNQLAQEHILQHEAQLKAQQEVLPACETQ